MIENKTHKFHQKVDVIGSVHDFVIVPVTYKEESNGLVLDNETLSMLTANRVTIAEYTSPSMEYLQGKPIFVHHSIGTRHRQFEINGKAYAKVKSGLMYAYKEGPYWRDIDPEYSRLLKPIEIPSAGNDFFVYSEEKKKNYKSGIAYDHVSGEYVYFRPRGQYIYEIEGEKYTRIKTRNILFTSRELLDVEFDYVEKRNSGGLQY